MFCGKTPQLLNPAAEAAETVTVHSKSSSQWPPVARANKRPPKILSQDGGKVGPQCDRRCGREEVAVNKEA
jgi:hypothetical protein